MTIDDFSETLSGLILENCVTVEELSKAVWVDSSTIYKYISKRCLPTIHHAIALADYFQCSLDYLFGKAMMDGVTLFKRAARICLALSRGLGDKRVYPLSPL